MKAAATAWTGSNTSAETLTTVLGPVSLDECGIIDAHNHMWIDPVEGADPDAPVLVGKEQILAELIEYRRMGGFGVVDCQPGGCGRNGNKLVELSLASGVAVIAATGFHRRRYYPSDYWMWSASAGKAAGYFIEELQTGLRECLPKAQPPHAGFIKVACEAFMAQTPQAALRGAAMAAAETGAALQIHTEKGASAEIILSFFLENDVKPHQIVLCHMDKRPDRGLHQEIAQSGALLEYDTFYRPYYQPDKYLWPLLEWMISAGHYRSITLATDMAQSSLWHSFSKAPGLPGLITNILARLEKMQAPSEIIAHLLGKNIARCLASQN
jgi:5-phospho-D-xylono-1,4-lactonase